MDPLSVIEEFYDRNCLAYTILVAHSRQVAQKGLEIARGVSHLDPDLDFIEKAAMLHDIGIFKTAAPAIGCFGDLPYVCHGYLGRELLDGLGLPEAFGLVAERHTGAGITLDNIMAAGLPLPKREMVPITIEEKIICCADKFFSKTPKNRGKVMTREKIIKELHKIHPGHAQRFRDWAEAFKL